MHCYAGPSTPAVDALQVQTDVGTNQAPPQVGELVDMGQSMLVNEEAQEEGMGVQGGKADEGEEGEYWRRDWLSQCCWRGQY